MTEPAEDATQDGDQPDTDVAGRDPLTTDDGLEQVAAAGMPEVEDSDVPPGEDSRPLGERALLNNPGLDVDVDGGDPCADAGRAGVED